jgi:hypothetical protein
VPSGNVYYIIIIIIIIGDGGGGVVEMDTKFWSENPKGREHSDLGVHGRVILPWILVK